MVNNRFVARILAPLVIVAGRPAATAMLLHQLRARPSRTQEVALGCRRATRMT